MVESKIHFVLHCTGLSAIIDVPTNLLGNKNKLPEEEFIKIKTPLNPQNIQEAKYLKEVFSKRDIDFIFFCLSSSDAEYISTDIILSEPFPLYVCLLFHFTWIIKLTVTK